jgi:putative heme-binding domain-containing protein
MQRTFVPLVLITAALIGARVAAQHGYTQAQVDNGGRLYQASCATCHGAKGDTVRGAALMSGKFSRATSDEELVRIILSGIPGTAMPPNPYTESEAGMIVAYLRSVGSAGGLVTSGDPVRGKAAFDGKGRCQTCHGAGGAGSRTAPSLADVGAVRTPVEIERAIVDPSAELHPDFRVVRAVTTAGETVTGRLLNQTTFSIQLLDSNERLRGLQMSELRESAILTTSPMPAAKGTLSAADVADLVAYLSTLVGRR